MNTKNPAIDDERVPAGFWNSRTGLVLRWLFYIPLGLFTLKATQLLSLATLGWLFQDFRGFIVVGVLSGGLAFVFFAGYIYYGVFRLITKLCPSPKPGMVVFGTFFFLAEMLALAVAFNQGNTQQYLICRVLLSGVCASIALCSMYEAWTSKSRAA